MPTEYSQLSAPGVMAANTVSTTLTCFVFAFSMKLAIKSKTTFDVCSVLMILPLLIADISYWLTIAKVIPVTLNEPPRTMSLVITCGLGCALYCHRFSVFARAGVVDWYTPRRSRLLVVFMLAHTFTSTCIMIASYWIQWEYFSTSFPSSPFRKPTQIAQFSVNMPVHLGLTFMTFRIVWDLRAAVIRRKSVQNSATGKSSTGKGSAVASEDYNGMVTLAVPEGIIRQSAAIVSISEQSPASEGAGMSGPVVRDMKKKSVSVSDSGAPGHHFAQATLSFQSSNQSNNSESAINLPKGNISQSSLKHTLKAARQRRLPRADLEFYQRASKVLISIAVMVVSALSASVSFVLIYSVLVDATGGSLVRVYILSALYMWHHTILLVK